MSHAIELSHLSVRYRDQLAVNDLSMTVNFGEIATLLGPNGAGKTSTIETLLGFRSSDSGTARLMGLDPQRHHADVVRRTGALLQNGGVWAPMTPRQVLTLSASYYAAPRSASELLDLLDLERCARTPWRRLSGGEQRRTLLALALLGRPRVLVLDEPTTSVDPEGRQVIRDLLRTERDRGCALLLTTHELDEAERLSDQVTILHHGRVLEQGSLEKIAGDNRLIVETSRPVNEAELASALSCEVRARSECVYLCATSSSPETLALLTAFLGERQIDIVTLRTRASLEESYLELLTTARGAEQ